jgi:hypothetical protein
MQDLIMCWAWGYGEEKYVLHKEFYVKAENREYWNVTLKYMLEAYVVRGSAVNGTVSGSCPVASVSNC